MPRTTHSASTEHSPTDRRASPDVDDIAIVGSTSVEARELCAAAAAAGLRIRPIGFESPIAEAAMAAFGPGSVRLPLVIVGGRYALERPDFAGVLDCIDLLRGADRALPGTCAVLGGPTLEHAKRRGATAGWQAMRFALTVQPHRSDENGTDLRHSKTQPRVILG